LSYSAARSAGRRANHLPARNVSVLAAIATATITVTIAVDNAILFYAMPLTSKKPRPRCDENISRDAAHTVQHLGEGRGACISHAKRGSNDAVSGDVKCVEAGTRCHSGRDAVKDARERQAAIPLQQRTQRDRFRQAILLSFFPGRQFRKRAATLILLETCLSDLVLETCFRDLELWRKITLWRKV
jgi:hypothetical protein